MSIMIGSAHVDFKKLIEERIEGYKGEVSQRPFFVHKSGWFVLRPKDKWVASWLAKYMLSACMNKNCRFNRDCRLGILSEEINIAKDYASCDETSLVRACILLATKKDVGDFNLENECDVLELSGIFETRRRYDYSFDLQVGDVLVSCQKGETAIVTSLYSKDTEEE